MGYKQIWNEERTAELVFWHSHGFSGPLIADRMGLSPKSVGAQCARLGLKIERFEQSSAFQARPRALPEELEAAYAGRRYEDVPNLPTRRNLRVVVPYRDPVGAMSSIGWIVQ